MPLKMFNYFLFLVIFGKSTFIYGFNEPRIRNGEFTPDDLFQFAVRTHNPVGVCTGSIISKRYVLTAAHCIEEQESSPKIKYDTYEVYQNNINYAEVRPLNIVDKSKMPKSINAYITKNFASKYWRWKDIAVIEFPEGTDFGIEPVKLAKDYIEKEGDEAYITGFGAWWLEGNKTSGGSTVLRQARVSLVMECFGKLTICAGNSTHQGLLGDSGGPMIIQRNNQWYQIGVASSYSYQDWRTRISSYCNFIEEVTKNEVKCVSIFPENQNNNQMIPKQFPPIYKGQETPLKIFDFVIPLYTYFYYIGCTATVISKRHLLTSGICVYNGDYAPVSTNSNSKSVYGIFFPDFRSKNVESSFTNPVNAIAYFPLNYKWPWTHNLAIIEFPEGTDFKIEPVKLAKDYVRVYLDNSIIVAGYGKYDLKKNMHINGTPPILQHSYASFQLEEYTDKKVIPENTNLMKDEGGPTLIERNGKFYQIIVNVISGTPDGFNTAISSECNFIEEVTKNEVQCESIAPFMASESTTTFSDSLPLKQEIENSSDASKIGFQMKLFVISIFTIFSLTILTSNL